MKNIRRLVMLPAISALLLSACAQNSNMMGTANNPYQVQNNSVMQNGQIQSQQMTPSQQLRDKIYDIDLTVDQQLNMEADMQALNLAAITQDNLPELNLTVDQKVKIQSIMHDDLGSYQQKLDAIYEFLTPEQRQQLIQMHAQYMSTDQGNDMN